MSANEGRKTSLTGVLTDGESTNSVPFPSVSLGRGVSFTSAKNKGSSANKRLSQGSNDKMVAMTGSPTAPQHLGERKLSRQSTVLC